MLVRYNRKYIRNKPKLVFPVKRCASIENTKVEKIPEPISPPKKNRTIKSTKVGKEKIQPAVEVVEVVNENIE